MEGMKVQLTFKSGAQISVDVDGRVTTMRSGALTGFEWTAAPDEPAATEPVDAITMGV